MKYKALFLDLDGTTIPNIADFVVPSVDEDGVATVIEKFILNR